MKLTKIFVLLMLTVIASVVVSAQMQEQNMPEPSMQDQGMQDPMMGPNMQDPDMMDQGMQDPMMDPNMQDPSMMDQGEGNQNMQDPGMPEPMIDQPMEDPNMQDQGMMDQGNDDQNMQDDQQYGNANAAEQSQGMPSCEEEVKMLEQRIADLEKLLEESGIEVPEPSDDVPSEDVPGQDMQNEADKGQNNNQEKGQKQGLFKRFIGFLGLGGTEYLASEECPDGTCTDEEMQLNLCAEDCQYANAPQEGEAMPQGEMANVPPGEQGQEMPAEPIDDKMLCGDGTCDEYESSELCPEDCE